MTVAERQKRVRELPVHIVVHMGGAWKLSALRYAKLIAAVRQGQAYDLDALGRYLGPVSNPSNDALFDEMAEQDATATK